MAITIDQQPSPYTPVYNPMRFVLTSTNYTQPNFQYVVDVYTSGVVGYTRLLFPPHPTSGKAAPDIQGVLESQISYDLSHTTYDFQRCPNSIKAYEVKFGEQYGPSSGIVTYQDLTVTGVKYAWNGVLNPLDFITFDYTLFTCGLGGAVLTNSPDNLNHYSLDADNAWLYFINDTSGCAYYAHINVYNSSNVVLSTARIENQYQASSSYLDKMLRVAVGTEDILNSSFLTLLSGSGAFFSQSGYDHYDVTLKTYAGVNASNTFTFYKRCTSKYGLPIKLYWLNRLGGFDYFDFTLVRRFSGDKVTDSYQKNLGELSGSTWGYDQTDRGNTIYNTSITDKLLAESDFVSTLEAGWIQELFESPEVYYHTGLASGRLVPVDVKQTGYEKKTITNDKCFNISIEVTFANKRWTQRG